MSLVVTAVFSIVIYDLVAEHVDRLSHVFSFALIHCELKSILSKCRLRSDLSCGHRGVFNTHSL